MTEHNAHVTSEGNFKEVKEFNLYILNIHIWHKMRFATETLYLPHIMHYRLAYI